MELQDKTPEANHHYAIVDMGSNGIRFSITDMSPKTARVLPVVYQDRTGISLYDAQWSTGQKAPIPESTTQNVIRALLRFKRTCRQFGVSDKNVRILATEATRQAINSEDYRKKIKDATGWEVEMLPKEEEGRIGAMGVVSSFSTVKGLMMDLGGGSTQMTWLIAENGNVRMSPKGSVSMPYGAAALMRRLGEAQKVGGSSMRSLMEEITESLRVAIETIGIPQEILNSKDDHDGITLYLSGGGFRGWGFLLMSQHPVSPYPIPIINGFKAPISTFRDTSLVKSTAASEEDIFRVSERRASQVPAVALLVSCMIDTLPNISTVRFAQGGVREGSLFSRLPDDVKSQRPLVVGTSLYRSPGTPNLQTAVPKSNFLDSLGWAHVALENTMYLHNNLNKDLKSAAALRSTTTGALAGIHGVSHNERAMLAIMLCERWGGFDDLPPGETTFYARLTQLLGSELTWWCIYVGRVAAVLGTVYPAGLVPGEHGADEVVSVSSDSQAETQPLRPNEFRLPEKKEKPTKTKPGKHNASTSGSDADGGKKHDTTCLRVTFDFGKDEDENLRSDAVIKALRAVEKMGKKKNWPDVDGKRGCKIDLRIKCEQGAKALG